MAISGIFVALCLYELYKQVKAYGWKFEWRFFTILFMITSLLGNSSLYLSKYGILSLELGLHTLFP